MRIGLFGGTFNPIHNGHIKVALEVRSHASLDTIYFIPSLLPPHKGSRELANAGVRREMIRESLARYKGLTLSDIELKRPGPSYTIDTVKYYQRHAPKGASLFLIMGMDAFLEIETWKSFKELFKLIPFLVMTRSVPAFTRGNDINEIFENYLRSSVSSRYYPGHKPLCFEHPEYQPVEVVFVSPINISSSRIRERVRQGKAVGSMVSTVVEKIIEAKGLYI